MRWIRTGQCHRDPARCGEWGCCWVIENGRSVHCPYVKIEGGLTTCEFSLLGEPEEGEYWGDPDKQDEAVLPYSSGASETDRHHFCKRFPWHPRQIGAFGDVGRGFLEYADCGYDFLCSECGKSFREHPQEDVIEDRCSSG